MSDNCPICGRHLNPSIYSNDPILATPSLSTDQYKGFTTLIITHIEELQIERHQQEIDSGVTPLTVFSPINESGLFQNIKQYILELRSSTEKILAATGITLTEFLSTDEDGNPMTPKDNWTDVNLEANKFQCKAIHIEDLRHFISSKDIWAIDITSPRYTLNFLDKNTYLAGSRIFSVASPSNPFNGYQLTLDDTYFYVGDSYNIYFNRKSDFSNIKHLYLSPTNRIISGITVDSQFIWVLHYNTFDGRARIGKIDKNNYTVDTDWSGILPLPNTGSSHYGMGFVSDKNYLYACSAGTICRVEKSTKNVISAIFSIYGGENGLAIDSNYLYIHKAPSISSGTLYKINFDLTLNSSIPLLPSVYLGTRTGIVCGANNIYIVGDESGSLVAYTKNGDFLWNTSVVDGYPIVGGGSRFYSGHLASLSQYTLTL
jgi:hypothetical protein